MSKIKILIVDDYQENITALSGLIAREDVEIHTAMNADDALELVSKEDFGLALLDVQMPGMSGYDLARVIRGVKRFRTLPIIFVTAQQAESSVLYQGYQSGAVDVLFKPLNPDVVRAKVQMFVELAQQKVLLEEHVSELERLRVDADAANLAKSLFLANMSHEIRTPLGAVMGFAELISKDGIDSTEKNVCTAAIKRNGDLLLRLIDDILDLSKIEANRLELESVAFPLNEILSDVISTMSFRAQENGVELKATLPESPAALHIADPVRIKQVLINVIGNAIKFSPGGKVNVQCKLEPVTSSSAEALDKLFVVVTDEGQGLTSEQASRLFQPFVQADASTNRKFGGSGLGLYISRQIANAHGGDVKLSAIQPKKGASFEIEILLRRGTSESAKPSVRPALKEPAIDTFELKNRSLLIVDDSPDNLKLLELYLRKTGADLVFATSGAEALAHIQKKEFDLVLMDIQMPGMNGYETTEAIRKLGFKKPVVALTAHALKSEHDRCKASGCDQVLTKPISKATLHTALQSLLG